MKSNATEPSPTSSRLRRAGKIRRIELHKPRRIYVFIEPPEPKSRHKVGDLVEVFFERRGMEAHSNRIQITEVLFRKGVFIYVGVRVMDYSRWKDLRDRGLIEASEAMERDFLEEQIGRDTRSLKN